MQAGAMGLPSIKRTLMAVMNIRTANIYSAKDSNAPYKSMKMMVDNAELRSQLQQNARPMIVSRHEQQPVLECYFAEQKLEKMYKLFFVKGA
jgi:hypothetical protein